MLDLACTVTENFTLCRNLLLGTIRFAEIVLPTDLAFVHRPGLLTHSYDKCIQVGDAYRTAEVNCRREGLILHGIEAPYLHPRTELHLPPVLVSRVIRGSSPLNLLEVVSLKKNK